MEAAQALGLDPRRMVEQAGLPLRALTQPDTQISAAALIDLLRASAQVSGREDFGLLMSDVFSFSILGVLGLLMREQPTVGHALTAYQRFASYVTNMLSIEMQPIEDEVMLRPVLLPAGSREEPIAIDLVMGDMLKVLRALLGPDWRPRRVTLVRRRPIDDAPYRQRFGPVAFDQAINSLTLSGSDLARPIANADPQMAREIARYLEASSGVITSLADQVAGMIITLLPSGDCSVEQVARRLGVDRRTIHRRLAQQGQSFSSLVDLRRRTLLAKLLRPSGPPLTTVAEMLGFASLSTFSRWHRHAFGGTARQAREAQQPHEPAIF